MNRVHLYLTIKNKNKNKPKNAWNDSNLLLKGILHKGAHWLGSGEKRWLDKRATDITVTSVVEGQTKGFGPYLWHICVMRLVFVSFWSWFCALISHLGRRVVAGASSVTLSISGSEQEKETIFLPKLLACLIRRQWENSEAGCYFAKMNRVAPTWDELKHKVIPTCLVWTPNFTS